MILGQKITHRKYGTGEIVLLTPSYVGVKFPIHGRVNLSMAEVAKFIPTEHPVVKYLRTENGKQFIDLLRRYEHTMYAKVRSSEKFFSRYETATGEKISPLTKGVLISTQADKWGDELSIRFALEDFSPIFPADASPRMYDGGKGILNDNDYIWALIEHHGFRFGRVEQVAEVV